MGQGASSVASVGQQRDQDMEAEKEEEEEGDEQECKDYTLQLPDECLAYIFQRLGLVDRNPCSLICKRWNCVEAHARQGLSLVAHMELVSALPALLSRFAHVTKLSLKCDRKKISIDDKALLIVGQQCSDLEELQLKGCKQLTDEGLERFLKLCGSLKKFSCGSCSFGVRGVNSILRHCSFLEDLTIRRLRGLAEKSCELIDPGCGKIRTLCLIELYNAQLFGPLIAGSKNLHTLMIRKNSGNWDSLLETITKHVPNLSELHMERLQLSDRGLHAISKCSNLEALYLVKEPECSNNGLSAIAEGCRKLRKLYVDGWEFTRLGDKGLISVACRCRHLQELVLMDINVGAPSLELIASNCVRLERLVLCSSETLGDHALSCIAMKCCSLKRICIQSCPITDKGLMAFANSCPMLVKIKVKKCWGVTAQTAVFLREHRPSLIVSLDCEVGDTEPHMTMLREQPSQAERVPVFTSQTRSPLAAKFRHALFARGRLVLCKLFRSSAKRS